MSKFPIQPIITDERGDLRFRRNTIVTYLLDNGGIDLNHLTDALPDCQEDWEQFMQLIGYSLSGFGDLRCASAETIEAAESMARGEMSEKDARIRHLESIVEGVRQNVSTMVPLLFRVHPDDLQP